MLSLKFYTRDVFELHENNALIMQKKIKFSHETQKFLSDRTQTSNTFIHA